MNAQSSPDALLGKVLDEKYRIESLLGAGGMGRVYRACHVGTGRPVALKVILEGLLQNAEAVARFGREAQAAGSIRHPNVVDVTDFGVTRDDGSPRIAYLVMEYLEGRTLKQLLDEEKRLPLALAVDIVEQVAVALEEAHRRAIVHRDLKPDNIWLVPDPRGGFVVKVLDFGVAALVGSNVPDAGAVHAAGSGEVSIGSLTSENDDSTATAMRTEQATVDTGSDESDETAISSAGNDATRIKTGGTSGSKLTVLGSAIGTPAYMSPEQCRGEAVDARSDLYALALVAFEMLTGRRAFEGGRAEVVRSHMTETPPRANAVCPDIPSKIAAVIARSLSKDPAARHPSTAAFAGSLRVAAEGVSVTLRRALSLYSDRFDRCLGVMMRACRPLLPVLLLIFVAGVASVVVASRFRAANSETNANIASLLVSGLSFSAVFLWMAIAFWSHSLFAFAVDEFRVRPLTALTYETVAGRLARRVGMSPKSGFLLRTLKLGYFYFTCERHAPVGTGDLAFIIAALEDLDPKDAGVRCRVLGPAVEKTYASVRISIILTLILIPAMETATLWSAAELVRLSLPPAVYPLLLAVLIPLNALWMMPIFSIALALVYFRSRQAEGEDVSLGAVVSTRL